MPVLLLLHGTGGDESDLLPLGEALLPGAPRLSPRGKVLENGMPRFFRRLAEGVFDLDDLRKRTDELADFVEAADQAYGLDGRQPIARRLLQRRQHRGLTAPAAAGHPGRRAPDQADGAAGSRAAARSRAVFRCRSTPGRWTRWFHRRRARSWPSCSPTRGASVKLRGSPVGTHSRAKISRSGRSGSVFLLFRGMPADSNGRNASRASRGPRALTPPKPFTRRPRQTGPVRTDEGICDASCRP